MNEKETVEVYEQGTGKVIERFEHDIEPAVAAERAQVERKRNIYVELDDIKKRLARLEKS
jgi:hypothetical protein